MHYHPLQTLRIHLYKKIESFNKRSLDLEAVVAQVTGLAISWSHTAFGLRTDAVTVKRAAEAQY